MSRDNATLEQASRVLALCGAATEARSLSSELEARFPEATLSARLARPVTAAILALQRGDAAAAIELLEPARPYDRAPIGKFWPRYLRGQAHLRLGSRQAAATEFRSILGARGEVPTSILYPLAYLGLARATADTDGSAAAYRQFLELWANADPDLQPLHDARVEFSRLE
jgi:hypothetical protein